MSIRFGTDGWRAIVAEFDLSERQTDVAKGIVDGMTEKEIAAQLGISVNTVHVYVRRLFERLDVNSRSQVVSQVFVSSAKHKRRKR